MIDKDLEKDLNDQGIQHLREIPGQGICGLESYIYTVGLNCHMDKTGKLYRYCYHHFSDAYNDLKTWDGNGHPDGPWIKRKGMGDDISNIPDEINTTVSPESKEQDEP